MKSIFKKISDILSWVVLIALSILLVYSVFKTYNAQKTGESYFMFGYRPVLVLTGSMEPYMMTNSLCITKEVNDLSDVEVGDVVTYHIKTEDGRTLRITHRIQSIDENGEIITKGDNNHVDDGYPLTMDNIESKVIMVFNQTAWIAAKWQTTAGKVMIISFTLCILLLFGFIKMLLPGQKEDDSESGEEDDTALEEENLPAEQELEKFE